MRCRSVLLLSAALAMAPGALAAEMTAKDIITPDMLGAQLPYLESKAGPAFKIFGNTRIYRLSGCDVSVSAGDDSAITGFRVDATEACSFDLAAFGAEGAPPLAQLTFGALEKATANLTYQADCLTLCGNAADPVVFGTWEGGRFNNLVAITAEAALVNGDALDAADAWRKEMEAKEGQDYLVDTTFNCDGKYNASAQALFRDVKVTSIQVGHEKVPLSCGTTP